MDSQSVICKDGITRELLKNINTQQKAFCSPQSGRFREIDKQLCEYFAEKT